MLLVYSFEPFEPDFLSHGGLSAYPADCTLVVFPSGIYYGWTNASADGFMADAMRRSAASKKKYDPDDVMGLAGGWKF